jgi:predicted nucleotidyltransferase/uncharacterized protein with HEPN domain
MSERDDTVPLRRMLDSARAALELLHEPTAAVHRQDDRLDLALAHVAQAVGFAGAHVAPSVRRRHPEIPWDALRQRAEGLLENYDRIDADALRASVEREFPRLVGALQRALDEEARRPGAAAAAPVAPKEVDRRLGVTRERLERFCRDHHIRRLSVFGSVLREDFHAGSDVDVLVEFEPGKAPGLGFFAIEDELSALLGRPVDLLTRQSITPHLRDRVGGQAQDLSVAGS